MDEREKELDELRNYGHKLLEELRCPDVIGMLQETITHISSIAEEYSHEVDEWRGKYDECSAQNEKLQRQIEDLKSAGGRQNQELREIIKEQARQIERMGSGFAEKMEALRSYRDQEINEHKAKLQALIDTQTALDKMKNEVLEEKQKLEKDIDQCEKEKAEYEAKRKEYEEQIELNQAKLDEYQALFDYKLEAEQRITEAKNTANEKDEEAKATIKDLSQKYEQEKKLREDCEAALNKLQNQLTGNENAYDNGQNAEGQNEQPHRDDDDDDSTR